MIEALRLQKKDIIDKYTIDDFYIIENIGKNRWGNICKIMETINGQIYLANIIDKNELNNRHILLEQIQMYCNVSGNSFIENIEAIFENEQYIFIFQEYNELELANLIENKMYWWEVEIDEKIRLFCNIVKAVNYCHQNGIIHMNICYKNILINTEGTPVLTNFSWCCSITSPLFFNELFEITEYCCPDVTTQNISTAVDSWALGVLFWEIFSCSKSVQNEEILDKLKPIERGLLEPDPTLRWNCEKLLDFLSSIGF